MRILVFLLLIGVASATPASAAFKGCYERLYTAEHMAANKGQNVSSMQVQLGQTGGGEEDDDTLGLRLRFSRALYYTRLFCKAKGAGLVCTTDKKGDSIRIDPTAKGMKLTLQTNIFMPEEAMGGDIGETLKKGRDNGVFALVKVSSGYCEKARMENNR